MRMRMRIKMKMVSYSISISLCVHSIRSSLSLSFLFIFPYCRLLIRIRTLKPATLLSNMYFVYSHLALIFPSHSRLFFLFFSLLSLLYLSVSLFLLFFFAFLALYYHFLHHAKIFSFVCRQRHVIVHFFSSSRMLWKCGTRCILCFCSFVGFVILCTWNFDPFLFSASLLIVVIILFAIAVVEYCLLEREQRTTQMLCFWVLLLLLFLFAFEEGLQKKKTWRQEQAQKCLSEIASSV